jgi:hypothetical protein
VGRWPARARPEPPGSLTRIQVRFMRVPKANSALMPEPDRSIPGGASAVSPKTRHTGHRGPRAGTSGPGPHDGATESSAETLAAGPYSRLGDSSEGSSEDEQGGSGTESPGSRRLVDPVRPASLDVPMAFLGVFGMWEEAEHRARDPSDEGPAAAARDGSGHESVPGERRSGGRRTASRDALRSQAELDGVRPDDDAFFQ